MHYLLENIEVGDKVVFCDHGFGTPRPGDYHKATVVKVTKTQFTVENEKGRSLRFTKRGYQVGSDSRIEIDYRQNRLMTWEGLDELVTRFSEKLEARNRFHAAKREIENIMSARRHNPRLEQAETLEAILELMKE